MHPDTAILSFVRFNFQRATLAVDKSAFANGKWWAGGYEGSTMYAQQIPQVSTFSELFPTQDTVKHVKIAFILSI